MQRKRSSRNQRTLRTAGNSLFNFTGKLASKGFESAARHIASNARQTQEFITVSSDIASIAHTILVDIANLEFEIRRMMRGIEYEKHFDRTGSYPNFLQKALDWLVDSLVCLGIFILALILPIFTFIFLALLRVVIIILCYAVAMGALYLYFK